MNSDKGVSVEDLFADSAPKTEKSGDTLYLFVDEAGATLFANRREERTASFASHPVDKISMITEVTQP